jgi:hypothetical protein
MYDNAVYRINLLRPLDAFSIITSSQPSHSGLDKNAGSIGVRDCAQRSRSVRCANEGYNEGEKLTGLLAQTPIGGEVAPTDLGDALEGYQQAHCRKPDVGALGYADRKWADLMRARAQRAQDVELLGHTERMLELLREPEGTTPDVAKQFLDLYDMAGRRAYPLSWAIRAEIHDLSGVSEDYTLQCLDRGMLQAMDDEAVDDPTMKTFVNEMLERLQAKIPHPRHKIYPAVLEIYSEALVYRLLKERVGAGLRITKIPRNGPDFECVLQYDEPGVGLRDLTFYIEVKTLDIVNPTHRREEMLDEGLDTHVELERQRLAGKTVAMAEQVIAPYRKGDDDDAYDCRSPRQVIQTLIRKAAGNFKASQFKRGPTFALASLLRLPLPGQGASSLAPFFYLDDPVKGGACVSGVLWHLAFGQLGAPMHRQPDFEGAGTDDGTLEQAGLLVDPAIQLPAAGLMVFYYDRGAYRFDGLYDAKWTDAATRWGNVETEVVLNALCGDVNDRDNGSAYKYALYRARQNYRSHRQR